MSLTDMYPAKNNSPSTVLSADISSESTTMTVENAAVLPTAPNIAVIGNSEDAEIIKYTAVNDNTLTIIRGINGTVPGTWAAGTAVARNITALDHEAFRENIIDLDTRKANAADVYNKNEVDTELAEKQDSLTFDSTPTASSTNPVTSGGVKSALDGKTPLATGVLRFTNQSTSATTSSAVFCTINNSAITTKHVVIDISFSNPAYITSDVSWSTDTAGRLTLTGINTNAGNKVAVTLGLAGNI